MHFRLKNVEDKMRLKYETATRDQLEIEMLL